LSASPAVIRKRRLVGLGIVVVLLAGGAALVALAARSLGGGQAATTVAQPPPPPQPLHIVFPEGFTRAEMARRITAVDGIARAKRHVRPRLSARAYLRATERSRLPGRFARDRKARPLEGFLFPATFEFLPKTTSAQLVRMQLTAFSQNWARVGLGYARSKNLTPYDVLTIASMIEKEAAVPAERRLIAAVIYNRLRARMPLGIDATIRYGLGVPGTEALRQSQLQSPSPYNTRVHAGLPPTPIANPGLASMKAAAHPARVDYLYFVRKPDKKHHFFTSSYRAFVNYANAHGY
jgi:UPF0755 protein